MNASADLVRRHAVGLSVGSGIVVAHAGAYAFFAGRDPYAVTIFPPCPLLHLTGWQCPGCGGTRALYSLLHGDIVTSLAMNPVVIAGYLSIMIGLLGIVVAKRGLPRAEKTLYWLAAGTVLSATVWSALIRNLLA